MAVASKTQTRLQLAHEPGRWTVTLRSGEVLEVTASAYGEADDSYQFFLLMEGEPPFEREVFRVSREAVAEVRGG